MSRPAQRTPPAEAPPEYDPRSTGRRLAHARAKRQARLERQRSRKFAGIRFGVVILFLLSVTVAIGVFFFEEIQRLWGL